MAPAMKRPAAASASAPVAKAKKEDPAAQKCSAVIQALEAAEAYPAEVLEMLAGCARRCLLAAPGGRHRVQNEVLSMVEQVLDSTEGALAAQVASLEAKVAHADAERASREATSQAKAGATQEAEAAEEAAKKALASARGDISVAQGALSTATKEQKVGDADLVKAEAKRTAAQQVVNGDLAALKDGSAPIVGEAIKSVMEAGKSLELESQLLASGTVALAKAAHTRTSFDTLVVGQVDEQLAAAIGRLTSQLNNGEASRAGRAAKVADCKAKLEAAAGSAKACREAHDASQAALQEARSAQAAADESVANFGPELEAAGEQVSLAKVPLEACREVIAGFKELVNGPPAEPEAPVEPEAAAA